MPPPPPSPPRRPPVFRRTSLPSEYIRLGGDGPTRLVFAKIPLHVHREAVHGRILCAGGLSSMAVETPVQIALQPLRSSARGTHWRFRATLRQLRALQREKELRRPGRLLLDQLPGVSARRASSRSPICVEWRPAREQLVEKRGRDCRYRCGLSTSTPPVSACSGLMLCRRPDELLDECDRPRSPRCPSMAFAMPKSMTFGTAFRHAPRRGCSRA